MARRSGFSRGRPRSSGVSRDWGAGPGGTGVTNITASGSAILGNGVVTVQNELTILRTRGLLDVALLGAATANGDGYFGAVGICVVTDAAFTAGITAIPTPITEAVWNGWLWHQFISVYDNDISGESSRDKQRQYEIDSKAMRKFDSEMVVAAVIEVVEIGGAALTVFLDTRMLFQDSGR